MALLLHPLEILQQNDHANITTDESSGETQDFDIPLQTASIPQLPYALSGEEPQIMQDFVDAFLPTDACKYQGNRWLPAAMQLAHHGPDKDPATLSLRALAMVRVGYRWCDGRMIVQGQRAYGMALKTLQTCLYALDEHTVDVAIASCRFLAYYEMFTRNGNAAEPDLSWTIHQAGVEQLVRISSKQRMGGELLQGAMDLAMRKAIAKRQAPDLVLPRKLPLHDQVWSHGLNYSSILPKLDECRETYDTAGLITHITNLIKLDQQMQSWYLAMSLRGQAQTTENCLQGNTYYQYKDLENAHLAVVHWALRMILSRTISETIFNNPTLVGTSTEPAAFSSLLKQFTTYQRTDLALKIMRSAWFFASGDFRATGYIRFSFAYHHAIRTLLEDPKSVQSNPWLKSLPLSLFTEEGVPIHGLPPKEPPQSPHLRNMCVMDSFVKTYYGWPRDPPWEFRKVLRWS